MRLLPYILKTLWRHRARTILTVSGSAVALFVFCFVGSVQQGMNDLQRQQSGKRSLIVFQANKFCPATSHLPQDYEQKIQEIEGVREVVPIQVFTNNCRASLDVVVFYGVTAEKIRKARPDFQLLEGSWDEFENNQDSAIVGNAVAKRNDLKKGDTYSIGSLSVSVAAIYTSDDAAEENYVYSHLDFLQRRKGMNLVGTVTQLEVLLDPSADADTICRTIDQQMKTESIETDTRPKGVFQAKSLGDLTELIGMAHYLGMACVGLVLAMVATTTVMSVQDRIKEHAVLQTIGYSGAKVFQIVIAESSFLSLIGGLVGVAVAMLVLQWSSLAVGASAVTIAFKPSLQLAITGVLVSGVTGLLAGIFPAIQAARTEIVKGLRQG